MHSSAFTRILLGGVLGSALLTGAAHAQTSPSAAQIISALKPTGTVGDTTRGIKPLAPGSMGSMGSNSMGSAGAPSGRMGSMGSMGNMGNMAMGGKPVAMPTAPRTNLNVEFRSGSAQLTPQALTVLNHLGQALTSAQLAAFKFKIVGHTDTTGNAATNQTLSEQRAETVKDYLTAKFNVPATRLDASGTGSSDLLVSTPPNTPDVRNRRVEIINLGQ